jgi:hypothetical protein
VRADGGTVSITVADDQAGAEASNAAAADWLKENMPDVEASPQVSVGDVVLNL